LHLNYLEQQIFFTPLRKDDGFLYSDTETKAEILNDQFYSVYTREDMTSMPEKGQSPYPDMPDIHIGEAGVLKLLNNINSQSWAFLASLCTVVFSCLYLAQSFVLFVCLALENAFCRLRSKRLMSVAKAEILNDQFHSVYTREDMTSMPEKGQSPYLNMPDIHIGEAGVLKLLNNISDDY
jgi:hypothetical protein